MASLLSNLNKNLVCFFFVHKTGALTRVVTFLTLLLSLPAASITKDEIKGKSTTPIFQLTNPIPKGFEDLSEPRKAVINIYFGQRLIDSQFAIITPDTIKLSSPTALVKKIPHVKNESLMLEVLTKNITITEPPSCSDQRNKKCIWLDPATIAFIFDEEKLRADLLINRQLLIIRKAEIEKFLPASDSGPSFVQNFNAAVSGNYNGNSENRNNYAIYGTSLLSSGENSIYAGWNYSNTQNFSADSLFAQKEFKGMQYQGGIINSEGLGFSFLRDKSVAGFRVGDSNNTKTNTSLTGGVPLNIFMPTRGRAEIKKNDRLIATFFFEAGNQQLDTSSFPSGAYDVQITILDQLGSILSSETRFFAKQPGLPSVDEWLHFLEAGSLMERDSNALLPKATNQLLVRSGLSKRLNDTSALTISSTLSEDNSFVETSLLNLGYFYELSSSVLLGDKNTYGANWASRITYEQASLDFNYQQLWNTEHDSSETNTSQQLLGQSFTQYSYTLSTPVFNGNASYRYSENSMKDSDTTRTHALSYQTNLYQSAKYSIDVNISLSQSGSNKVALLNFYFNQRNDHWSWKVNPKTQRTWSESERSQNDRTQITASWDDKDIFKDTSVLADFSVEAGTGQENYNSRVSVGNQWGKGELAVNHTTGNGEHSTSYVANINSTFAANSNDIAIGGEKTSNSAVIININGDSDAGGRFNIYVDGKYSGYAYSGQPSLIPLLPYNKYSVKISPSDNTLYNFEEKERNITLYPGNVVSLDYDVVSLKIVLGRLILNNNPISNAKIIGGLVPNRSEETGLFQLELPTTTNHFKVILNNGATCKVNTPKENKNSILNMGVVDLKIESCHKTTTS